MDLLANQIGSAGIQHLANALENNIVGSFSFVRRAIKVFSSIQMITIVDLQCNRIDHQGARYLAKTLECNRTITTLNLRANMIHDDGVQHLADGLQKNTV